MPILTEQFVVKTILATIFVLLVCIAESSIGQVIPGPGFTLTPQAPVPPGYADSTLRLLLPKEEWVAEGFTWNPIEMPKAFMVDYGKRGGLITIDQLFSNDPYIYFSLLIERPAAMPLRHKIVIGTDKASWEIIDRAASAPSDAFFYRSYILRIHPHGPLISYIFFEGAMVKLEWEASSNDKTLRSIEALTDRMSKRLRENYATIIAPIANSLEDGSPILTRPDLPDPDERFRGVKFNYTLQPIQKAGVAEH
jgi:hypothetical protein